ncbi:Uncharacterised protein [Klebsiella pneumoniae]|nr:Uncharacterised protein [Klebsiella pneumoniae]
MLYLSLNPKIRHQKGTSQLCYQFFLCIIRTAKLPFHFTVQTFFATTPVNQLMQTCSVEISRIRKQMALR